MEDLGISLEQFEEACRSAKGSLSPKFHRTLFEQIWAANDFGIFKALMIKRNLELHIQAMNVLARSLMDKDTKTETGDEDPDTLMYFINDDALMEEVVKLSLQQSDEQLKMDDKARDDVVKFALDEKNRLESEKKKEEEKLEKALKKAMSKEEPQTEGELSKLKKGEKKNDGKSKKDEMKEEGKSGDHGESSSKKMVSSKEIEERQEYLRKRRDQILETKQREREKQVKKLEESELKSKRPKSAKALRSVINKEEENDEEKGLGFRRSLAARLKSEVINQ